MENLTTCQLIYTVLRLVETLFLICYTRTPGICIFSDYGLQQREAAYEYA